MLYKCPYCQGEVNFDPTKEKRKKRSEEDIIRLLGFVREEGNVIHAERAFVSERFRTIHCPFCNRTFTDYKNPEDCIGGIDITGLLLDLD